MTSSSLPLIVVFLLITLCQGQKTCPEKPEVAGAWVCGTSWSSSGGVRTDKAKYCCIDGSVPKGDNTVTCVNYAGWSKPQLTCSGSECGVFGKPSAPFRQPTKGNQCKNGVTAPSTRCLADKAADVFAVSQSEVVDRHNCWRSKVNPPAKNLIKLGWDDELALLAERWAAQCPSGHDAYEARALPGRSSNGINWKYVGQNICYSSHNQSWSQCIDAWAGERKDFTYGVGQTGPGPTGHYTQVVAERSHFVGCGMAYCPNSSWKFVQVCNYGPAGNFNGGEKTPYAKA